MYSRMLMILTSICIIATSGMAGDAAPAGNWSPLRANDGSAVATAYSTYFCNIQTIVTLPDGHTAIWLKEELAGDETGQAEFRKQKIAVRERRGQSTDGWDRLAHTCQLYQFDCEKNEFRLLEIRYHTADGTVLDRVEYPEPRWSHCTEGSTCATVLEACCQLPKLSAR